MAEVKTVKRTLTNPNPCMNHVNTVRGVVPVGPNQTVEVEVDESVSAKLDKLVERGTFAEGKVKPAADAKTADKTDKK